MTEIEKNSKKEENNKKSKKVLPKVKGLKNTGSMNHVVGGANTHISTGLQC